MPIALHAHPASIADHLISAGEKHFWNWKLLHVFQVLAEQHILVLRKDTSEERGLLNWTVGFLVFFFVCWVLCVCVFWFGFYFFLP